MKSDHRHELKTNELADWMAHIPEWSKKNAKPLIGGTALVVLIVVAVSWSQYNNTVLAQAHRTQFTMQMADLEMGTMQVIQSSLQGQDMSIALSESSDSLGVLAENATSETMAAMAYLKQAEMLREQIHFEHGQPTEESINDRIETAKAAYNMALENGKANKTLLSVAQYGLGLCAEEQGRFEEAASIYQALISDDVFSGTVGRTSAIHRLESIAHFRSVVTFPIVEVTPEAILPDITQVIEDASVTQGSLPEIGPALPEISAAVAPNAVPADANAGE